MTKHAGVRIKLATPADRDVIRALQVVCLPHDRTIDPSTGVWWVGRDPAGIAVCYAGAKEYRYADESALVLTHAGVIERERGKGLQKKLIEARVRYARKAGLPEVWTYTALFNIPSGNSLIACGFQMWRPKTWGGEAVPEEDRFLYWRKKVK